MQDLVLTIIADGKKFNEVVEITSSRQNMALGRMSFAVGVGSELHDIMSIDSDVPVLCSWGVGVTRSWFELQCNTDNTYFVQFGRV